MLTASLLALAALPQTGVPLPPLAQRPAASLLRGVVALDGPAQARTVRFFHGSGAALDRFLPAALRNSTVELLPLDVTGRTQATDDLPGAARWRSTGGIEGLELPAGRGSLHRIRRTAGAQSFEGLLYVPASGFPRIAIELPANGPGEVLLARVAVDAQGRRILVGTTLTAGGDLFEVDLVTHRIQPRTVAEPPLDLRPKSLFLAADFGFAVAAGDGVWRFESVPGAQAARATVAGLAAPTFWPGDAALSPRGRYGVVLAGASPTELVPFVVARTGALGSAGSTPMEARGAGTADESTFGPFLAVGDDGRTVGWGVQNIPVPLSPDVVADTFVGRAGIPSAATAASGDTYIQDTLSEIGRVLPSPHGGVLFVAGEPNDPTEGGLETADLFEATVDAQGNLSALRNITATIGYTAPPFDVGTPTLTPVRIDLVTPTHALVYDDNDQRIAAVDITGTGLQPVFDGLRDVHWLESMQGGAWCASVELDSPLRERLIIGASDPMQPATVLHTGTPTTVFDGVTSDRTTGRVLVRRRDLATDQVLVVRPAAQSVSVAPLGGVQVDARLAFLGPDAVAYSIVVGAAPQTVAQEAWNHATGARRSLGVPGRASVLLR